MREGRLTRAKRRPDTGMTKPYRPAPADFRETYIRIGWDGIADHYRTNYRCIARWIEECGGDELRRERSQVSGSLMRPAHRSHRYRAAHENKPERPQSGAWLRADDGAYRLLLSAPQIRELEQRFAEPRAGGHRPKPFSRIHADLGTSSADARAYASATGNTPAATVGECVDAIRLALIGGGMAVIDGRVVTIDGTRADRFVQQHLLNRPLEHARRLASTILAWTIMGPPQPATISIGEVT